jgi:hypothetical protein
LCGGTSACTGVEQLAPGSTTDGALKVSQTLKEGTTSDENIGRHSSQMHSIGCLPFIEVSPTWHPLSHSLRVSVRVRLWIRVFVRDRVAFRVRVSLRVWMSVGVLVI